MFLSPVIVLPHVFELSYYGNQVMSVFALESLLGKILLYLYQLVAPAVACSCDSQNL